MNAVNARRLSHPKYVVLDGVRGVAAVAVLMGHIHTAIAKAWPAGFYLAVDLFFMLSGFVIALAYQERLKRDLSLRRFLALRLVRLFPLYLLGSALNIVCNLSFDMFPFLDWQTLISSSLPTLLMLPVKLTPSNIFFFPYNPFAWSLFMELLANLAFAAYHRRTSNLVLVLLCLVGFLGLWFTLDITGTLDVGARWNDAIGGVPRVMFSFTMGILLFRLHASGLLPRLRIHWSLVLIGTTATFYAHWGHHLHRYLYVVALAYPVVILLAAECRVGAGPAKFMTWLGFISYPLYSTQIVALTAGYGLQQAFGLTIYDAVPWGGIGIGAGAISLAYLTGRFLDVPIRNHLTGRMQARHTSQPA